jgi:type II secretory pathway pseudopilin PulG
MAQKYTILKVFIHNSSKVPNSTNGFTLIELIFGLLIMVLVGGFAMNALVDASNTFNKDKKNIDSSQNLSAILEIIGNDIKQAGEQIGSSDSKFPVVTIEPGSGMPGSSKITVHRAFVSALTLCQAISSTSSNAMLVVADNNQTASSANCSIGATVSTTNGTTTVTRPTTLREARDYRCKLDNPNGDYSNTSSDFCNGSTTAESVLAAISDSSGNIRSFRYINDSYIAGGTASITITPLSNTTTISSPNTTASYAIGSPLYLIEKRVYTLDSNGNFQVQIDDQSTAQTLLKGIQQFKASAKIYSDTTNRITSTSPPNACASTTSYYSCTYSVTTSGYSWKNIAGVKIELEAKYDATGRASTTSVNAGDQAQIASDKEKLKAQAEFFPRNVLSR